MFFSYLDEYADITDVTFRDRPRLGPLDKASQRIMRGTSPFSPAQRELMAAYVSGLNACSFCHGAHTAVAQQFGIAPHQIEQLVDDIDTAPLEDKMKPIFHYLRKLTLAPSKLVQADVDKVRAAGWSEEALHQAILVGCLFNFYNRLLDGHGIKGNAYIYQIGGEHLYQNGYGVPWFIGLIRKALRRNKIKKLKALAATEKQYT